jgi:histidinol phosphatase-like enzyme
MNDRTIIVDFDGTITTEIKKENGPSDMGPPKEGVQEALQRLKDLGYKIQIHSCRTATYWGDRDSEKQILLMREYLAQYNIPYDGIITDPNSNKPRAKYYIDNRAIRFEDNWDEIVDRIENLSSEI